VAAAVGNFQLLAISDARNAAQTIESVRSSFYSVARQPSPPGGKTDIGAAEFFEEEEEVPQVLQRAMPSMSARQPGAAKTATIVQQPRTPPRPRRRSIVG